MKNTYLKLDRKLKIFTICRQEYNTKQISLLKKKIYFLFILFIAPCIKQGASGLSIHQLLVSVVFFVVRSRK